jgi:hypothetical protein
MDLLALNGRCTNRSLGEIAKPGPLSLTMRMHDAQDVSGIP